MPERSDHNPNEQQLQREQNRESWRKVGIMDKRLQAEGVFQSFLIDSDCAFIIEEEADQIVVAKDFMEADKIRKALPGRLPDTPTVHIHNPDLFLRRLNELENLIDQIRLSKLPIARWYALQRRTSIFLNATNYDMEHSEDYLQRLVNESRDTTFDQFPNWSPVAQVSPLGERMFIRQTIPSPQYESPRELQFAFSINDQPTGAESLPAVRYGRPSPEQLVVYAVQMPALEDHTERSAKEFMQGTERNTKSTAQLFKRLHLLYPAELEQALGPIPPEILGKEEPAEFVIAYYDYLHEQATAKGIFSISTLVQEEDLPGPGADPDLSLLYYRLQTLENMAWRLKDQKRITGILQQLQERKEKIRRFNPHLKGSVPPKLRQAPPGGVISLAAASKMFQQDGVKDMLIAMEYPVRAEGHDPKENAVVREQLKLLAQRLAHEVKGVEITEISDEDGVIRLKFTQDLSSDRPFLKQVLESVNYSPYPKPADFPDNPNLHPSPKDEKN